MWQNFIKIIEKRKHTTNVKMQDTDFKQIKSNATQRCPKFYNYMVMKIGFKTEKHKSKWHVAPNPIRT